MLARLSPIQYDFGVTGRLAAAGGDGVASGKREAEGMDRKGGCGPQAGGGPCSLVFSYCTLGMMGSPLTAVSTCVDLLSVSRLLSTSALTTHGGLSKTRVPTGMDTVLYMYDSTAKSVNDQNVIDAIVNKHTVQLTPYYIYYKAYSIIRIKRRTQ